MTDLPRIPLSEADFLVQGVDVSTDRIEFDVTGWGRPDRSGDKIQAALRSLDQMRRFQQAELEGLILGRLFMEMLLIDQQRAADRPTRRANARILELRINGEPVDVTLDGGQASIETIEIELDLSDRPLRYFLTGPGIFAEIPVQDLEARLQIDDRVSLQSMATVVKKPAARLPALYGNRKARRRRAATSRATRH